MNKIVVIKILIQVGRRTPDGKGMIFRGERGEEERDDNGDRNVSMCSLGNDMRFCFTFPDRAVDCFLTVVSCRQGEPCAWVGCASGLSCYAYPRFETLVHTF